MAGFVPSLIGHQAGGAADLLVVVPVNLKLEQWVGAWVILDAFVGQEGEVQRLAVR